MLKFFYIIQKRKRKIMANKKMTKQDKILKRVSPLAK
ncbi:MAG: hypothetical protein RI945_105, partial [Candidatus Parcubacteria bacterium]